MPIKVEAAIITQKRPSAAFNTDSVNLNGKVFDREVIRNGYKGSGVISDNAFFAFASSEVDGFADAAVAAFNDSAADFTSRDPQTVLEDYFEMCKNAPEGTEHKDAKLCGAALYACGRKIITAFGGNIRLYSINSNGFNTYNSENTAFNGVCNTCVFPDVAADDIFVLVSPGVCDTLSDKDISDICKVSDGSVKRIASLITKVALSKVDTQAISVIAVKILETGLDTEGVAAGFVPDFSDVAPAVNVENEDSAGEEIAESVSEEAAESEEENTASDVIEGTSEDKIQDDTKDAFAAAVAASIDSRYTEILGDIEEEKSAEEVGGENIEDSSSEDASAAASDETAEVTEAVTEENSEEAADEHNSEENVDEKSSKSGSRQKFIVAICAMAVLSVFLFIVVFAVRFLGGKDGSGIEADATADNTTAAVAETTEEDTAEVTSEETATEEETTEAEEETTTKAEEKTTKAEEKTTKAEEKTTKAEEKTTKPEETTAKPEETTAKPEETTAKPEETTAKPEETTAKPEETTAKAEETTVKPEETTAAVTGTPVEEQDEGQTEA